jgi:type I restriction enzyme S subunit
LAVPKDALLDFEFPLPPPELHANYQRIAGLLRERMNLAEQESDTLVGLRDTLLPKLIAGELRVPEAEKTVEAAL